MDWISDHHLSKLKNEEYGIDGGKPVIKFASQRNDIQEKCVKVCFLIEICYSVDMKIKKRKPMVHFTREKNIESIFDGKLTIPIVISKKIYFRLN